jgi:Zn-dependent protease with chaperone function
MIPSPKELIHKNERKYFIIALIFSLITYIGLFVSVIGIVYVGLFLVISLFLHAMMLGFIRTNGVRLNEEQFPEVYDKVKELCGKMEMKFVPDVYVMESSGTLNAFATRFFGRNMVVLYSTIFELIEEGAEDELTFVIAHELAHIKRRHISTQLMILPAMWIPGVTQAYSRACEYTCDRYAAYYTENSEAAKHCLTIFGVGKILSKYVNRTSYLNQAHQEKGFFIWLSEKLSTHPPLPKRINEIGYFMGDMEKEPKPRSKARWIWIPASLLILALMISGGIYAFEKLDTEMLMNEIEMNLDIDSTPPLIDAVVQGDLIKVNELLQEGVELDTQDFDGWTALHWAVQDSNVDVTQAILGAGANPNIEDDYYGGVPLMTAASNGDTEIVTLLLQAGADINHQDYDGWTPLMYAVSNGQIDTVQALLAAGASTEHQDYSNSTALMHAIRQGHNEIVSLLRNHN